MLLGLFNDPFTFLFVAAALLVAITIHEFAHALVADRFGDTTARLAGRISLNPFAHLDLYGTLSLLLIGFGWGKPVPVNSRQFAHPIRDEVQVALAGPFANLTLAVVIGILLRLTNLPELLTLFLQIVVILNINLLVFNLIPIPPLDGSRILQLFVSPSVYQQIEQVGSTLLLVLVFASLAGFSIFQPFFNLTVSPLIQLILGSSL